MAQQVLDKTKSALGLKHHEATLAGHKVGSTGFGLMGFTWRGPRNPPQEQAFAAMKEALKHGANFWNGGEIYGNPERNSLHLLREYYDKYPEDVKKTVVSIKGGCEKGGMKPVGTRENTQRSIQECIDVAGAEVMKRGLWESARVDLETPVEITMRAAKEFVDAGKLGGISLSECSAETIRRPAAVAKIEAVEIEYSLLATEIVDNGVASTCAELGIPVIAYSPLGRGFLTGQVKSRDDLPEGDLRRHFPRFSEENFDKNFKLVEEVQKLADKKGVTPGQVGMAWVSTLCNLLTTIM